MVASKVSSFLLGQGPSVLALVGESGCGKHHVITDAARQVGIGVAHHDLAQGAVVVGRLGEYQLGATGLTRGVHVISNASEAFLKDYSWVKSTRAKIVLVADDAGQSMRTSGVPVVKMQALSSDAMSKKLYHEEGWSADAALHASRAAQGNWHQLRAQEHFAAGALSACGMMDATLANDPPYTVASRLLNGTAPEALSLDPRSVAWAERNQAVHCDDIEMVAQREEAMAVATMPFLEANPVGEDLFKACV